jgi:hypothetical protein
MDTVLISAGLTRAGSADTLLWRGRPLGIGRASFRELRATVAQSLAERVTLPHRDLPPEWFRFPLP